MLTVSRRVSLFGKRRVLHGVAQDAYLKGVGEASERLFAATCRRYLRPDAVVLDVGANIGVTALIAADMFPAGQVYAVEASPEIFSILQTNLAKNEVGNVRAFHFAAGARAGEVTFLQRSAYGHIVADQPPDAARHLVRVPLRRCDDLLRAERIERVDFVKIDVEGFEQGVLEGLTDTDERDAPLYFVEFNSWTLSARGRLLPVEFLEYIRGRFAWAGFFDQRGQVVPFDDQNMDGFLHRNMVEHGCVDDILMTNRPERMRAAESPAASTKRWWF